MIHAINYIATTFSVFIIVGLIFMVFKSRLLRKSIIVLIAGIFISITMHSIFELLESLNYIEESFLIIIMPIFIIIGSAIILLSIFFILNQITIPLKKLTKCAKKIKKGNLSKKCDIKSKDEIGELADAFEEMSYSTHY